jgi:peptide/nickel transport system substrate-binding protein
VADGTNYTERCLELVFVSCDADVNSAEWDRARKVRLALAISIDRDKLVNNLAAGEGAPYYLRGFTGGHVARAQSLGLDQLVWEFDPERARELLAEAGLPNGFTIDFALPLRPGAAGAIVAGEAIAAMWQDIGVESNLAKLPMSEYRGGYVRRSNVGVNAHNGNPPIEPLRTYTSVFNSANSLNFGFEHPEFQAIMDEARTLVDDDARWDAIGEMTRFIFDNVMSIPVYTQNEVWPLGPNIGRWDPLPRVYAWLSNWEDVPHR